jgi:hypothetical protein
MPKYVNNSIYHISKIADYKFKVFNLDKETDYIVEFSKRSFRWICDCIDFHARRSKTGEDCIHIKKLLTGDFVSTPIEPLDFEFLFKPKRRKK